MVSRKVYTIYYYLNGSSAKWAQQCERISRKRCHNRRCRRQQHNNFFYVIFVVVRFFVVASFRTHVHAPYV